jgi:choline kinase
MNPTLVLLAAGMSSRYGRLKQLEPVGPAGEALLDFAVADAVRAGFTRVVLIIREELEAAFRDHVRGRWPQDLDVAYHHQHLGDLPGVQRDVAELLSARTKPWGTAHALLTAGPVVQDPFVVLNADDFYGAEAFRQAAEFLGEADRDRGERPAGIPTFALVTYTLGDTLSDHGGVSRGICQVDEEADDRWLRGVREVLEIQEDRGSLAGKTVAGDSVALSGSEAISTNFWVLTPEIFPILERRLSDFLAEAEANPDSKLEFLIPTVVNEAVANGEARVRCIPTRGRFLGITHPQDRDWVVRGLEDMTNDGRYPRPLWG